MYKIMETYVKCHDKNGQTIFSVASNLCVNKSAVYLIDY